MTTKDSGPSGPKVVDLDSRRGPVTVSYEGGTITGPNQGSVRRTIDSLEKSHVGRTQFAAYNELSIYFLAAALALLTAEALLRTTVWRRAA